MALSIVMVGTVALTSCANDVEDDLLAVNPTPGACDTSGVTFQSTIMPILDQRCNTCHGAGIELGNVLLEPYAEVLPYITSERLICSVLQDGGCSPMPKNSARIPDCEIASLQKWISDGAPNN